MSRNPRVFTTHGSVGAQGFPGTCGSLWSNRSLTTQKVLVTVVSHKAQEFLRTQVTLGAQGSLENQGFQGTQESPKNPRVAKDSCVSYTNTQREQYYVSISCLTVTIRTFFKKHVQCVMCRHHGYAV